MQTNNAGLEEVFGAAPRIAKDAATALEAAIEAHEAAQAAVVGAEAALLEAQKNAVKATHLAVTLSDAAGLDSFTAVARGAGLGKNEVNRAQQPTGPTHAPLVLAVVRHAADLA